MSVSAGKLVTQANCCIINTPQSTLGLARLSGVLQAFATNWCVPCTACLPAAADNKGRWIFITQTCDFRYSDGTTWTNDFSSCTICCSNIWSWGANTCFDLGDNTTLDRSSPVREISCSTNWCAITTSSTNTIGGASMALKSDGSLWSWGVNTNGMLGDNSTLTRSSPTQEISKSQWLRIAMGNAHSAAIKSDNTLWAWGQGSNGKIGQNNVTNRSSPVLEITSTATWCAVAASSTNTAAIRTNGSLWMWGDNACGQTGDNTTIDRSSPVQEITSSTNWCSISSGAGLTNAIKTDGTLWGWGFNPVGTLGDNSTINRSSPVQEISCSTTWCTVSRRSRSVAAIKTNGSLWTWGEGSCGRLGNNSLTDRCSPVREITSGTNWCQVSMSIHAAAITTTNQLYLWGLNNCGQLGDNSTIDRSSPVREITSGSSWCAVSAGKGAAAGPMGATIAIQSVFCKGFHSA